VRVPSSIKRDVEAIGDLRGETVTEIIEAALRRYVSRHRRLLP
jgi:hypothetical protein